MQPNVPARGAHYAVTTVKNVLQPDSPVTDIQEVDDCLIHTGSKKILDGVCSQLDLQPDSAKVHGSYQVLQRYGNLSSASTGFMLAEKGGWSGPAMVVGLELDLLQVPELCTLTRELSHCGVLKLPGQIVEG